MADNETIFAKIVRGEIPCEKVYEDDLVLAFRDIQPVAPVHLLVIPKEPLVNLSSAKPAQAELLGRLLLGAEQAARAAGIAADGYRIVLNNGRQAGQEVMHLHLHVLGGRGFGWPPG
ncbi:MAG: histidine triad nucleotide-binding protein [Fimbriimonadaceae bacterium]|nr:histidine triad nucleotide-binding protein [Fimbriimonadaceae bacterium]